MALLTALYLSQGLPFGFFTQALPVLMREQGWSLGQIGLSAWLTAPWALKFAWAPLVDRFGTRRAWILALQTLTVLALLGLGSCQSLPVVMAGVVLVNLLCATQDVATDGLAVDRLPPAARGLANGLQVAGYRLGMILGGGVLLMLFPYLGWRLTFWAMAAGILLASLPVLCVREPARRREPLRGAVPLRILALVFVYKLGDAFAVGMVRPFLHDSGYSLAEIGWLLGTVAFGAGLLGALAGGALVNRWGRRRSLLGFGVLQSLAVLAYAAVAWLGQGFALACALEHFAGGMATAALFTCMMDWSRPSASATDYTLQASTVVLATGLAAGLSGFSAQRLGYGGHFLLAAGLAAVSLVIVAALFREREEDGKSHPF